MSEYADMIVSVTKPIYFAKNFNQNAKLIFKQPINKKKKLIY